QPVEPFQLGQSGHEPQSRHVRPDHLDAGDASHSAVWDEVRLLKASQALTPSGSVGRQCRLPDSPGSVCGAHRSTRVGGIGMRTKFSILVAISSLICSGAALVAHHSFTTEYDGSKTFNIKGTVSKVEWTNPHARFYVDTVDEAGKMVTWNMEL